MNQGGVKIGVALDLQQAQASITELKSRLQQIPDVKISGEQVIGTLKTVKTTAQESLKAVATVKNQIVGKIGEIKGEAEKKIKGITQSITRQVEKFVNVTDRLVVRPLTNTLPELNLQKQFDIPELIQASQEMGLASRKVQTLGGDSEFLAVQYEKLRREMGAMTDATTLMAASYDVLSSGFSDQETLHIVEASTLAAVGGFADLEQVADSTTTILNAFNFAAADSIRVVDQVAQTVNVGKITMNQYSRLVGQSAGVAAQFNQRFEEMNAVIARATVSGVFAGTAFTGYRQALLSVATPTSQAAKLATDLGVEFNAAALKSKGLVQVLQEVYEADPSNFEENLAILVPSAESLTAILPSLGKNAEQYAAALDSISNSSGTAAKTAEIANSGFAGAMQEFRSEIKSLVTLAGQVLTDFLEPIVRAITGVIRTINNLPEPLKKAGALFLAIGSKVLAFASFFGVSIIKMVAVKTILGMLGIKLGNLTSIFDVATGRINYFGNVLGLNVKKFALNTVATVANTAANLVNSKTVKGQTIAQNLRQFATKLSTKATQVNTSTTVANTVAQTAVNQAVTAGGRAMLKNVSISKLAVGGLKFLGGTLLKIVQNLGGLILKAGLFFAAFEAGRLVMARFNDGGKELKNTLKELEPGLRKVEQAVNIKSPDKQFTPFPWVDDLLKKVPIIGKAYEEVQEKAKIEEPQMQGTDWLDNLVIGWNRVAKARNKVFRLPDNFLVLVSNAEKEIYDYNRALEDSDQVLGRITKAVSGLKKGAFSEEISAIGAEFRKLAADGSVTEHELTRVRMAMRNLPADVSAESIANLQSALQGIESGAGISEFQIQKFNQALQEMQNTANKDVSAKLIESIDAQIQKLNEDLGKTNLTETQRQIINAQLKLLNQQKVAVTKVQKTEEQRTQALEQQKTQAEAAIQTQIDGYQKLADQVSQTKDELIRQEQQINAEIAQSQAAGTITADQADQARLENKKDTLEQQLEVEQNHIKQVEAEYAKLAANLPKLQQDLSAAETSGDTEIAKQIQKQIDQILAGEEEIKKAKDSRTKTEEDLAKAEIESQEKAKEETIEGIEARKTAVESYYDSAINGQEQLTQAIDQQSEAIANQISFLNEQLEGINLDRDFQIKLVEDDKNLSEDEKKNQIQKITQDALLKELKLREKIFALEQKAAELAAKKAQIEAKKATLTATRQLKTAELELQAAKASGDDQAIADAEANVKLAKEELALSKEQQEFANENAKAQKELAAIKAENFQKEKRNELQAAGLTDEAEAANKKIDPRAEAARAITNKLEQAKLASGGMAGGIEKASISMGSLNSGIAKANTGMGALEARAGGISASLAKAGASLGNLLGRAGGSDLMPGGVGGGKGGAGGGASGGGLPGGGSLNNTLGKSGSTTNIGTVNVNLNNPQNANGIGIKSAIGREGAFR